MQNRLTWICNLIFKKMGKWQLKWQMWYPATIYCSWCKINFESFTQKKCAFKSCLLASLLKGGLISDFFSLWLKFPEKGAKLYPDYLLFMWIVLSSWYLFWEIWAKVKSFLELSHLFRMGLFDASLLTNQTV
jgi:hypothetical protein